MYYSVKDTRYRLPLLLLVLLMSVAGVTHSFAQSDPGGELSPEEIAEKAILESEKRAKETANQLEAAAERIAEEAEDDYDTLIQIRHLGGAVKVTHSADDIVKTGGSVTVDQAKTVPGDVVCVGGPVHVYGTIRGDAIALGGNVFLYDGSHVFGDAVSIGGRVVEEGDAVVEGQKLSIAPGISALIPGFEIHDPRTRVQRIGHAIKYIVIAYIVLFFLVLIFIDLLGKPTKRVGDRLRADSGKAGLAGFLLVVMTPVIMVILLISVIGIPVAVIYLPLLLIVQLWGLTAVSAEVGRSWGPKVFSGVRSPRMTAFMGVVLLTAPWFGGKLLKAIGGPLHVIGWSFTTVGLVIVALASFVGIGGILFSRFGRRGLNEPAPTIEAPESIPESTESAPDEPRE